jgi:hypothetical protein
MDDHHSFFGSVSTEGTPIYSERVNFTLLAKDQDTFTGRTTSGSYDGVNPQLYKTIDIGSSSTNSVEVIEGDNSTRTIEDFDQVSSSQQNESQGNTSSGTFSSSGNTGGDLTTAFVSNSNQNNADGTGSSRTESGSSSGATNSRNASRSTTADSLSSVTHSFDSFSVLSTYSSSGNTSQSYSFTGVNPIQTFRREATTTVSGSGQSTFLSGGTSGTTRSRLNDSSIEVSVSTTSSSQQGTTFTQRGGDTIRTSETIGQDTSSGQTTGSATNDFATSFTGDNSGATVNTIDLEITTTTESERQELTFSEFESNFQLTETTEFTLFSQSETYLSGSSTLTDETTITRATTQLADTEDITVQKQTFTTITESTAIPEITVSEDSLVTFEAYGGLAFLTADQEGVLDADVTDLPTSQTVRRGVRPGQASFAIPTRGDDFTATFTKTLQNLDTTITKTTTENLPAVTTTFSKRSFDTSGSSLTSTTIELFYQTTKTQTQEVLTTQVTDEERPNATSFTIPTTKFSTSEGTSAQTYFNGSEIDTFGVTFLDRSKVSSTTSTEFTMDLAVASTVFQSYDDITQFSFYDMGQATPQHSRATIEELIDAQEVAFIYQTDDRSKKNFPAILETSGTTTSDNEEGSTTTSGTSLFALGDLRENVSFIPEDSTYRMSGRHQLNQFEIKQDGSVGTLNGKQFTVKTAGSAGMASTVDFNFDALESKILFGGQTVADQEGFLLFEGAARLFFNSTETEVGIDERFTTRTPLHQPFFARIQSVATATGIDDHLAGQTTKIEATE